MAINKKILMPRYGFLLTKFRGNPVRAVHGLCQGTVPCSSKAMIRSVLRSYVGFFIIILLWLLVFEMNYQHEAYVPARIRYRRDDLPNMASYKKERPGWIALVF